MESLNYIPKIIRAALDNDNKAVRLISLNLLRRLKKENPKIAEKIAEALDFNAIGVSAKRGVGLYNSPVEKELNSKLLSIEEPIKVERPIFNEEINLFINNFIKEREKSYELLKAGLEPTSSMIFYGPTGSGKTYLAKYLAGRLNLKFATVNLSTSISSYLGKTGQNIKEILDFAKEEPTVLLLDEFDAIAKRRDDRTELGELKRIVNVLLKELEDWPHTTILIAATNYPDLLDSAIWRRFDISLEVGYPEEKQRYDIISRALFTDIDKVDKGTIEVLANITNGISPDTLNKIVNRSRRRNIINNDDLIVSLFEETIKILDNISTEMNKEISLKLREKTKLSIKQIGDLLGKSKSAIQYYLK